ncbi:MAG: hypothetical protein RL326_2120 [Pseudomonadota bacterium]
MSEFAITPRVRPATQQEQTLSPQNQPVPHLTPIEGTIESSGLSMFRRLLMKGATALGLEMGQAQTPVSPTADLKVEEQTLTLAQKMKRALLGSELGRHLVHFGESLADMAYGAWERITGSGPNARPERNGDYQPLSRQTAPDTSPTHHVTATPTIAVDLKKALDDEGSSRQVDVMGIALHQCAEAVRRKEEEKHDAAHKEEQARAERTRHARDLIEAIDARGGRIANNPKVQAILASLGTPYDSVEQAITQVIALQQEEDDIDVH